MMKLVSFLFMFLLLGFSSATVASKINCGESFQSKLKEILAITQSCPTTYYENCCQLKQLVSTVPSGVYSVRHIAGLSPFSPNIHILARCEMVIDGGGWLVVQRRLPKGKVNFVRKWDDYENGFGDLEGEFWYGLKNIHALTSQTDVELRIDMVFEDDGSNLTWTYTTFKVDGASTKYKLIVGGGKGTGLDSFAYHNGQMFTTIDSDNDRDRTNCGFVTQAGWWYNSCYRCNLNGPHTVPSGHIKSAKLIWNDGKTYRGVSSVEMKIRGKNCEVQKTCQL